MRHISKRVEKLESLLFTESDTSEIERMTPEERQHRIAELLYKGLFDTDPRVMKMTEEEFITLYLSSSQEERDSLCGCENSITNDEPLNRLQSHVQYEERR